MALEEPRRVRRPAPNLRSRRRRDPFAELREAVGLPARTVTSTPRQARGAFWDLRARGLDPVAAGNLTAFLQGLEPVESGWTIEEIERLMYLRELVQEDRLPR